MSKQNRFEKASPQTQSEAMKAAMATQRPGQTKEQTKLIALGIQKGIDHYKKQHKSKSRELNKKINKITQTPIIPNKTKPSNTQDQKTKTQLIIPWALLISSWLGFISYFFTHTF